MRALTVYCCLLIGLSPLAAHQQEHLAQWMSALDAGVARGDPSEVVVERLQRLLTWADARLGGVFADRKGNSYQSGQHALSALRT